MSPFTGLTIDAHCHVGLLGDVWPEKGKLSRRFLESPAYPVFLLYGRIPRDQVTDPVLREKTLELLAETTVDRVVCLALDYVRDEQGRPDPERTGMYVSNEYVAELQQALPEKVLFGASVHPYAADFEDEVKKWVDEGAVLLKWLPSAQAIDLGSEAAGRALRALARLGPRGRALPLLLHTGAEYAVPAAAPDTPSLDFLSWSSGDRLWNLFRHWRTPAVARIEANLRAALDEGAVIIFAHAGLPYFEPRWLPGYWEHTDLDAVRSYLSRPPSGERAGRAFADVSACCTPFRKSYFGELKALPPDRLLFGSDFPTPIFDLHTSWEDVQEQFRAVAAGDFARIVVPEGNLLDVNRRELALDFGAAHPLFTNFGRLLDELQG
jgi:predicted TIM-barrel fold metal-dependent hydrolase